MNTFQIKSSLFIGISAAKCQIKAVTTVSSQLDQPQYKLESSHSPQVPPPRKSYSPGGVTIFALPAAPLCPL